MMKGKKCDSCGFFTLFQIHGFLLCSDCGISICSEWGEKCPFNLRARDQEKCLKCWEIRLSHKSRVEDGGGVGLEIGDRTPAEESTPAEQGHVPPIRVVLKPIKLEGSA